VRTSVAAQAIASCAERLGVASSVRAAVSVAETLARLAEQPADVVLVDSTLARPDPVAFTRRVLARAPEANLVLFGPEEPRVAAAAVAAGARGVIRGANQDLVTVVTKTLLLLRLPSTENRPAVAGGAAAGPMLTPAQLRANAGPRLSGRPLPAVQNGTSVVPMQRDATPNQGTVRRRLALTERELQVLRGMADGKSNAEIGRELYVSEDTVKTHARRLFRKLGARDRAHAVAAGFRAGLVT
jgi:DNA-binding NarL/FixJ family response regulator